jgi:hypothetical protein
MNNPFGTVFHEVGTHQLCDVEMVSIPKEHWEWTQKYIAFQERMYAEMKQQLQQIKGDK